jgi:hypothetical protein
MAQMKLFYHHEYIMVGHVVEQLSAIRLQHAR